MTKFIFYENYAIGLLEIDGKTSINFYSRIYKWVDGSVLSEEHLDKFFFFIKNNDRYYKINLNNFSSTIEFNNRSKMLKFNERDLYLFEIKHYSKCRIQEDDIIYEYEWRKHLHKVGRDDIKVSNGYFVLLDKPKVRIQKFGAKAKIQVDNIKAINNTIEFASANNLNVIFDDIFYIYPSKNNFIICRSNVDLYGINFSVSKLITFGMSPFYSVVSTDGNIVSNITISNISIIHWNPKRSTINSLSREQLITMHNFRNISIISCFFHSGSINMLNFNSSTSVNVNILNSKFIFEHNPLEKTYYDNSVIYSENKGAIIRGNKFLVSEKSVGFATCAIELHGDNQSAIDNFISNYNVGINVCSGYDLNNSKDGNLMIENNVFEDVNNGVHIWVFKYPLNHLKILNNKISINQFLFTKSLDKTATFATTGIRLVYPKISEKRSFWQCEDWIISNNEIIFRKETTGSQINRVYLTGGINLLYYSNINNLIINNNTITNSPTTGVRVINKGNFFLSNFKISNNVISNSGLNIGAPMGEKIVIEIKGAKAGEIKNNKIRNLDINSSSNSYEIFGSKIEIGENLTEVRKREIKSFKIIN